MKWIFFTVALLWRVFLVGLVGIVWLFFVPSAWAYQTLHSYLEFWDRFINKMASCYWKDSK